MTNVTILDDLPCGPDELLKVAQFFSGISGSVLLYSGGSLDCAQRSLLFLFPDESLSCVEGCWRWHRHGQKEIYLHGDDPWETLKARMTFDTGGVSYPSWVGFLGYEMGAFSDREKRLPYLAARTPDAYFQRCAVVLEVDNAKARGCAYVRDPKDGDPAAWTKKLSRRSGWNELLEQATAFKMIYEKQAVTVIKPLETLSSYVDKVLRAKEFILSGEVYEVCLSQQMVLQGEMKAFKMFSRLVTLNPAPFSAYLALPGFSIVSSSPERFLCKRGNRVETRPIKGTIPRGKDDREDQKNRELLLASEKDHAELLMIIDLARNDLGRNSVTSGVTVDELWRCERYTNVYHLVSIISAELEKDVHPIDVLRDCFPGGSITGCPKLRSMKIIQQLEKRPRGVYTGSIGYFTSDGDFDFNIAIRTVVEKQGKVDIQLGGAIVADSDPVAEYEETLHKGASIFAALGFEAVSP